MQLDLQEFGQLIAIQAPKKGHLLHLEFTYVQSKIPKHCIGSVLANSVADC